MNNAELKQQIAQGFAKINEATNNIAADIQRLADKAENGLSPEEGKTFADQLTAVATQLEEIAAKTPDGEPTPPVA